ncbi:hypothetical protein CXQ85_001222 [Candidozyma haemuli]|uniref:RWD domain-containing protein n=1 Tax=Candidozyma haemuli TaxID=45357 RepID=A0A2V1ALI5_9ASCO|nr:hypothetical protein CXQ85_001222 [[Candida] haemuloni]PVH18930.1 hypothetical protein CXQ85_001222 [[Candida] haemuloni]
MPSQEQIEEIDAIRAIYPESVKELTPSIFNITIPDHEDVMVQMSFPDEYPDERPNILQVNTTDARKYFDNDYIEKKIMELLAQTFRPSEVVVFELIGEITAFLEEYLEEHKQQIEELASQREQQQQKAKASPQPAASTPAVISNSTQQDIDVFEGWTSSDPILDRGSTFIAYAREVHSVEEAKHYFNLLTTDRKIAKATHNMNSWRIKGENGVTFQDCDDDGETAAGSRMLHLLTVCTTGYFSCSIILTYRLWMLGMLSWW